MGKIKGIDVYLKVNTGTEESPVWTKVGGQRDATLDRGTGSIDMTDKDSAGFEESVPHKKNWGISFNAFLIEDDAGFLELENAWKDDEIKMFQIITPGHVYQGKAYVTGLPKSGPEADAATVSFTLKGTGSLEKT